MQKKTHCVNSTESALISICLCCVLDGGSSERAGPALSYLYTTCWENLGSAVPSPVEDSVWQAAACEYEKHKLT